MSETAPTFNDSGIVGINYHAGTNRAYRANLTNRKEVYKNEV